MSQSHHEETLMTSQDGGCRMRTSQDVCNAILLYKVTLGTPCNGRMAFGLLRTIAICLQHPQDDSMMILWALCGLRIIGKNRDNLTLRYAMFTLYLRCPCNHRFSQILRVTPYDNHVVFRHLTLSGRLCLLTIH